MEANLPGVSNEDLALLLDCEYVRREYGISIRWKIQTAKGGKTRLVAYQDARDHRFLLNKICGPQNWSVEPRNINGKVYMSLSINTQQNGWVSKADAGEEKDIGGVKAEASDAFKRACYAWGLLVDVYNTEHIVLDYNNSERCPVTPDGELLKTASALNAYCNGVNNQMYQLKVLYSMMVNKLKDNEELKQAFITIKNNCNV